LFEVKSFQGLADGLANPDLEGFDEKGISLLHHALAARFYKCRDLPNDVLLGYDDNIVRHWKKIAEKRNSAGNTLYPKYFQYLALLFAEIYLDRFFRNPQKLLDALNLQVERCNQGRHRQDAVEPFSEKELNKVAFWMATGSGKTLLMHINILQYRHYLEANGKGRQLNRIVLLTPNEGLSRQHLQEFALSGIRAQLFKKDGLMDFAANAVQVIDVHKLRDKSGEKTVDVKAFEGNNLVLVDEGHRGASSSETGEWMKNREILCEQGFSFEYSATFGQAMKASKSKTLEQAYAKSILFDYSYKYFYGDGYGKDYRILNLKDDAEKHLRRYLTACLLSFYQQQKLYLDNEREYAPYLLEKPLWIFVGDKVTAVRKEHGRDVSDVLAILLFLAWFVDPQNRQAALEYIGQLLAGNSGLLDVKGNDLFATAFSYLAKTGMTAKEVLEDIFGVLFNSRTPAALHVENLKGADGEIALRLGDNKPFGVINVSDTPKLCKLCEQTKELVVTEREFG
ncbi:MAG: DEAD/DEAH box helicase family protein, partial [Desulfatibacillaceae bacterium]|nr:DEAD/DEAH box helicase family protein [Desulfatibacillaceae bacterium]